MFKLCEKIAILTIILAMAGCSSQEFMDNFVYKHGYRPPVDKESVAVHFGPAKDGGGNYRPQIMQDGAFRNVDGAVVVTFKHGEYVLLRDVNTTVEANKTFTFQLDQGANIGTLAYVCRPTGSVFARAGARYDIRITFFSAGDQKKCGATIDEIGPSPQGWHRLGP